MRTRYLVAVAIFILVWCGLFVAVSAIVANVAVFLGGPSPQTFTIGFPGDLRSAVISVLTIAGALYTVTKYLRESVKRQKM
jgi:hypothetical protein